MAFRSLILAGGEFPLSDRAAAPTLNLQALPDSEIEVCESHLPCPNLFDIMENGSSSEGKDPSAFLSEIIGAPVIVKLNSGVVYKGNYLTPHPCTICWQTSEILILVF